MTRTKKGMAIALVAVSSLFVAACGSDSSSSDTTAAATEDTTAAAGGDSLAAAQEIVDQFSARPTSIGIDTPISKEIPAGKKVYFITCGAPTCELEIPIIKEATDILGWELTGISTDGSPEQIGAAWDRVVNEKPDAVLYTATPQSQVADQMKAARANGTWISACCVTDPVNDEGPGFVTSTAEQTGELGAIMAAWAVTDMAGTPADVLYLDLPDFQILSALAVDFEAKLAELCAECGFEKIDIALADLGTANDTVVSYLRANPGTKYVMMSTDGAFSLPSAFEAAGLDDIKLFGEGPTPANLADIEAGRQSGTMAFAFYEILFAMIDAAARDMVGDAPIEYTPPNWILGKGNIPDVENLFPLVEDVVAQYSAIWGK